MGPDLPESPTVHPTPGLQSFCSNTPRQQQSHSPRTRRVRRRYVSQSHPHGGRDALGLVNALTGHLEVRARSLTHGLCYVNAYKLWSWWSSGRARVTPPRPTPLGAYTPDHPTSRFHCSGTYPRDPTLCIVPTHPLYPEPS